MIRPDFSLRKMAKLLAGPRSFRLNRTTLTSLADEFDATPAIMAKFVHRFCPAAVEDNRFWAKSDTMLFVHIPKTAGMSVGKAMQQAFDQFHGVEWNNIGPSFYKASRQAAYLQSRGNIRQIVMGHYGWSEMQLWRNQELPIKSATILRDPVQRMISNFNYNSSAAHPAHQDFVKRFPQIESYVESTSFDVQLSQAIGFATSFDDVLAKLTRYYSFIGVTERLSQSLAFLSRSHGLPPITEYHTNVGSKPADKLPDAVRDLILDRNHNDTKIHALMLRLYAMSEET